MPQKLLLGSLCFERLLFNRAVGTCLSFLFFSFSFFFSCFLCAAFLMNTKAVLKGRNDCEQVQYCLSVVQAYSSLRSSHLWTNTAVFSVHPDQLPESSHPITVRVLMRAGDRSVRLVVCCRPLLWQPDL